MHARLDHEVPIPRIATPFGHGSTGAERPWRASTRMLA